jgi:GSH-dependent disulfide-bond oxidoreductase
MLTLYSHDSPNVEKVRIALYELGVPFREEDVDLEKKQQKASSYLAINPNGRVPAIEDEGVVVWESGAILLHLALKHGALLPTAPDRRANALEAVFLEAAALSPIIGGYGLVGQLSLPEESRDGARIGELQQELARLLAVVDRMLCDGREYFAKELSIGDIQSYPVLAKAAKFGLIKPTPAIAGWLARMRARPSVQKAIPG